MAEEGDNKDKKQEWKKAVKLLKSKDHNKRMEGLQKAEADHDFIREGGALPPLMHLLTLTKKKDTDVNRAAVNLIADFVDPEEGDGTANAFCILKEGRNNSAADWKGGEFFLRLFDSKHDDLQPVALRSFRALTNSVAVMPDDDAEKAEYLQTITTMGEPVNQLTKWISKKEDDDDSRLVALSAMVSLVCPLPCREGGDVIQLEMINSGVLESAISMLTQGGAFKPYAAKLLLTASAYDVGRQAIKDFGGVAQLVKAMQVDLNEASSPDSDMREVVQLLRDIGHVVTRLICLPFPAKEVPPAEGEAAAVGEVAEAEQDAELLEEDVEGNLQVDEGAKGLAIDTLLQVLQVFASQLNGEDSKFKGVDFAELSADDAKLMHEVQRLCCVVCENISRILATSDNNMRARLCNQGAFPIILSILKDSGTGALAVPLRAVAEKMLHHVMLDGKTVDTRILVGAAGYTAGDDGEEGGGAGRPYIDVQAIVELLEQDDGDTKARAVRFLDVLSTDDKCAAVLGGAIVPTLVPLIASAINDTGVAPVADAAADTEAPAEGETEEAAAAAAPVDSRAVAPSPSVVSLHAARCLSRVAVASDAACAAIGSMSSAAGEEDEEGTDSLDAVKILVDLLQLGPVSASDYKNHPEPDDLQLSAPIEGDWPWAEAGTAGAIEKRVFEASESTTTTCNLRAVAADALGAIVEGDARWRMERPVDPNEESSPMESASSGSQGAARVAEHVMVLLQLLEGSKHGPLRSAVLRALAQLPSSTTRRRAMLVSAGWEAPVENAAPAEEEDPKAKKGKAAAAAEEGEEEEEEVEPEPEGPPLFVHMDKDSATAFLALLRAPLAVMQEVGAPAEHVYGAAQVIGALCWDQDYTPPLGPVDEETGVANVSTETQPVEAELMCNAAIGSGALVLLLALMSPAPFVANQEVEEAQLTDWVEGLRDLVFELISRCTTTTTTTATATDEAVVKTEMKTFESVPLLDTAVDFHAADLSQATALIAAVRDGLTDVIQPLLQEGANTNIASGVEAGATSPLMLALARGDREAVEALLLHDAAVDAVDSNGGIVLQYGFVSSCRGGGAGKEELEKILATAVAARAAAEGGGDGESGDGGNSNSNCALEVTCTDAVPGMLELLLEAGADPNVSVGDGTFPLHWASCGTAITVRLRFVDLGLTLPSGLKRGGEGNNDNNNNNNDRQLVQLLLAHHSDVAVCSMDGHSPLHSALLHGQIGAAALLLESGADPNVLDNADCLPIHYACLGAGEGCDALVPQLLLQGTGRPFKKGTFEDERKGKSKIEKQMLTLEAILAGGLEDVICPAAILQKQATAADILTLKSAAGLTALQYACGAGAADLGMAECGYGAAQIVDFLCEQLQAQEHQVVGQSLVSADATSLEGLNALHYACISSGSDVGAEGGPVKVVKALLGAGFDIDQVESNPSGGGDGGGDGDAAAVVVGSRRFAALHFALQQMNFSVAQVLLDAGAEVMNTDANPSALLVGCEHGCSVEMMAVLMKGDQNVNICGEAPAQEQGDQNNNNNNKNNKALVKFGGTPLHVACAANRIDLVGALLGVAGVNVNAKRAYDGRTPLHLACLEGHAGVVEQVVAKGKCDCTIPDADGDVAVLTAVRHNRAAIVEYLLTPRGEDGDEATSPLLVDWMGSSPNLVLKVAEEANMIIVENSSRTAVLLQNRSEEEAAEQQQALAYSNAIMRTLMSRVDLGGTQHVHESFANGVLYSDWEQHQAEAAATAAAAAAAAAEIAASVDGRAEKLFVRLDANSSGNLSTSEIVEMAKQTEGAPHEQIAASMISDNDTGAKDSELSLEEWKDIFKRAQNQDRDWAEAMLSWFEKMASNM